MAKRLKHVIGTVSEFQFTIQGVDFGGVKAPKNLTNTIVYFELEREGALVLAKDSGGGGGVIVTDAVNGVCVARIEHADIPDDVGGDVDYGVLVRDDPGGGDTERDEAIRGTLELKLELVNVP